MQFLGVHQPDNAGRSEPVGPQAIIVGQAESPGVSLDLGRTAAALPGATRGCVQCDVLLIMTRKQAVLLYFAVGEDIRYALVKGSNICTSYPSYIFYTTGSALTVWSKMTK